MSAGRKLASKLLEMEPVNVKGFILKQGLKDRCPNCSEGQLRRLTANEIDSAREDCAAANVPFDPARAKICDKCGYLHV